jgi:flavin reductase (DIM6/NTAB) family NADH-FMN oxidoreductase RutF
MADDTSRIAEAIGSIPSGCWIMTASDGRRSTGVLVSWVQQAGFAPPSISVAVRKNRPILELLEGTGRCVLNAVTEDPSAMFRHFGRGFTLDEDAFSGLVTESGPFGPELASCPTRLRCAIRGRADAGDHVVFVAEVSAAVAGAGFKPYVHLRRNGLSY